MKASSIAGFVGVAMLGGLVIASMDNAKEDQREREIREACLTVGAVDQACPGLFPDIEQCQTEDCSDIKGNVGYWQDRSDKTGRSWFLTARPGMREAPQKPEQS